MTNIHTIVASTFAAVILAGCGFPESEARSPTEGEALAAVDLGPKPLAFGIIDNQLGLDIFDVRHDLRDDQLTIVFDTDREKYCEFMFLICILLAIG